MGIVLVVTSVGWGVPSVIAQAGYNNCLGLTITVGTSCSYTNISNVTWDESGLASNCNSLEFFDDGYIQMNIPQAGDFTIQFGSVPSAQDFEVYQSNSCLGTPIFCGFTAGNSSHTLNAATAGWYLLRMGQPNGDPTGNIELCVWQSCVPPNGSASNTGPYCETETIQLQSSGGGTYSWSGPNGFSSTLQNPTIPNSDVNDAGTYDVVITLNGCSVTESTTVVGNPAPTVWISTVADCDYGYMLIAIPFPGWGFSYQYEWNNGESTQTIFAPFGDIEYSVTVTDINGCSASATVWLDWHEPLKMGSGTTVTQPTCPDSPTGSIHLIVEEGFPPYTYQWSDWGPNSPNRENLAPGTYKVTVTDGNGCEMFLNWTLSNPPFTAQATISNTSCNDSLGMITVTPFSWNAYYSYLWSTGDTTETIDSLHIGYYTVTITNNVGCVLTKTYRVRTMSITDSIVHESCDLGAIFISVSGGKEPYSYSWNNGQTSEDRDSLPEGIYKLIVLDSLCCSDTMSYEILDTGCDSDGDSVDSKTDNCPGSYNPGQEDTDGNGIGDECDVISSLTDQFEAVDENSKITLYPNPTSEVVHVTISGNVKNRDFSIFDITGKVVLTGRLTTATNELNVREFTPGMYVLKIGTVSQRFLKM